VLSPAGRIDGAVLHHEEGHAFACAGSHATLRPPEWQP
jgi:hypothetical protein